MRKKIGLFFGSFNPIHNGHLAIASHIVKHGNIDQLWFVVSPQNPLKERNELLDDNLRFEMVTLAIEEYEYFKACNIEFKLPQPSYTINTLEALKAEFPGDEFLLIMGSDNYVNLKKWKDFEKIIGEYRLLIYPRPSFDVKSVDLNGNFIVIDAPQMEISSTDIRKKISGQQDVSNLLPTKVMEFIKTNNLYK